MLDATGDPSIVAGVDASNDGDLLGAGDYTKTFTATIQAATSSLASIAIDTGDGQTAARNAPVPNPLVVIVRDERGLIDHGVDVIFTTDSGVLSNPLSTDPGAIPTTDNGTSRRRLIETDETGRASVRYNVGDVPGAKTVRASINTGPAFDQIRHVIFNINGTGSSGPNNPTTRSPYLSLSATSLTGSPGQQRSFTVTAYDANNQRQNINVNLSSSGVTVPSSVRTGESVSITLPSTSTTINVSASGYSSRSITVTVEAVAGNIVKVSGDSPIQTGAPGTQLLSPFVVRVDDRNNNPLRGQSVTFQVTGGGGSVSSSTATTDSSGQASTTLTLGSASGTNTVQASVSGVSPVTFTATARAIITRLQYDGGNNQSGDINSALDEPLSIRVVDQDNNGIPGELITFTLVEGSGRFSPIRARTDRDGYASTSFTPRSAGTIEIEASTGDLDPVTFTIITGNRLTHSSTFLGITRAVNRGRDLPTPSSLKLLMKMTIR